MQSTCRSKYELVIKKKIINISLFVGENKEKSNFKLVIELWKDTTRSIWFFDWFGEIWKATAVDDVTPSGVRQVTVGGVNWTRVTSTGRGG